MHFAGAGMEDLKMHSTNPVVANALAAKRTGKVTVKNADGVSDVNVQFNTITERGVVTIRHKFGASEFGEWMQKIGRGGQLQDVWAKLMAGSTTTVELPAFKASVK